MFNEINITISNEKHRAFFMNGFHSSSEQPVATLHKHKFSEIHFVSGGNAVFRIGETQTLLKDGSVMIIPNGVFHCCYQKEEGTLHNAFQVDFDTKEVKTAFVGIETVSGFFDEMERLKQTGNYSGIASYMGLFCHKLCLDLQFLAANPVTDYGFLVQEYLLLHYSENLRLSDLAGELHLSERQAERLVKEPTGRSFKDELCNIRMNIAKQLSEGSDMTLYEIARYVGYDSYAGFWKTAKRLGFSFSGKKAGKIEKYT